MAVFQLSSERIKQGQPTRVFPKLTQPYASGPQRAAELDLDLADSDAGRFNIAAFNKAVYSAVKPGGFYVVLDHSAAQGAAANVTEMHRIESSTVRREVEAAGFKFDSESSILANPADPQIASWRAPRQAVSIIPREHCTAFSHSLDPKRT